MMKQRPGRTMQHGGLPDPPRGWADRWSPERQKYLEKRGPVFAHQLTQFIPAIPLQQAVFAGHLNYRVELHGSSWSAPPVPGMPDQHFLVRKPIPDLDEETVILSNPLPRSFIARQPAEVLEVVSDFFPVRAAGPLAEKVAQRATPLMGARFMVVFDAGGTEMCGEPWRHYIILQEPTCLSNATMSLQYYPAWGQDEAMLSTVNLGGMFVSDMRIRRGSHWARELRAAVSYFRDHRRANFQSYMSLFTRMRQWRLSPAEVPNILDMVYYPLKNSPSTQARVQQGLPLSPEDREGIEKTTTQNRYYKERYPLLAQQRYMDLGERVPELRDTALGLYLAVCELEDTRYIENTNRLTFEALGSTQTRSRHLNKRRAFELLAGTP